MTDANLRQQDTEKQAESPLMDSKEAAALLSVSVRTLARIAGQGKVPGAVKVGHLWRFNRSKLYAFIGMEA